MKKALSIGEIQAVAVPALRVIVTIVVLALAGAGLFIYHNRHRLFDRDPDVDDDISAVRDVRVEEVMLVWGALTLVVLSILYQVWRAWVAPCCCSHHLVANFNEPHNQHTAELQRLT